MIDGKPTIEELLEAVRDYRNKCVVTFSGPTDKWMDEINAHFNSFLTDLDNLGLTQHMHNQGRMS